MLTRNDDVTSPDKFISDNLTHKPDVAQSAFDNLSAGIATAPYAIKSFDQEFNESPRGKTVAATFEALRRGNENPEVGWTQWGVNEASNMLGQTLNPLGFMFAEAGGLAVRPLTAVGAKIAPQLFRRPIKEFLGEKMGKYFPETIGSELEKQTLSMGLFGKELTKGFGIGAGAMLPQSVIDNFNAETGEHDILGIAKGMGAGGVFGMSIGTIPFAWGILKANVNRLRGRAATEKITPDEITKMVEEGVIDEDTAQFMKDMGMNVEPGRKERIQKFQERATKFVADQGHPVDHANDTAQFEILNRDQINNLQSATVDQLVSDNIPEEHRNALSDFTVQAGMDEMRNNPNLLDGVRGYVEYMDANLLNRDAILSSADRLVDQHLELAKEENHGFEQQALVGMVKKIGKESDHPFTIPSEVEKRINQEKQIADLERKNKKLFSNYERTGDNQYTTKMKENNEKIEEIRKELAPLKSSLEELQHIKNELFPAREREENVYYRGFRGDINHGYISDSYFGHGYWMSLDKAYATAYGSNLEKIEGKFNLYDFKTGTDKKLNKLFDELKFFAGKAKKNGLIKDRVKYRAKRELVKDKIKKVAKKKGYHGYERMRAGSHEVMLFDKPENVKITNTRDLIHDFKSTKEYQRLSDLAEVWSPAKTLLDRVHLEEEIRKQEAYRDLARQMLDIADSNAGAAAKVENVNGYMEARTKARIDEHNPKAELIELAKKNEVPADADAILAEHDEMVKELDHKNAKEEYEVARDKAVEFRKSENIFNNFIRCVIGSQK